MHHSDRITHVNLLALHPFLTKSRNDSCVKAVSFPPRPIMLSFSFLPLALSSFTPAFALKDVVASSAFLEATKIALNSLITVRQPIDFPYAERRLTTTLGGLSQTLLELLSSDNNVPIWRCGTPSRPSFQHIPYPRFILLLLFQRLEMSLCFSFQILRTSTRRRSGLREREDGFVRSGLFGRFDLFRNRFLDLRGGRLLGLLSGFG